MSKVFNTTTCNARIDFTTFYNVVSYIIKAIQCLSENTIRIKSRFRETSLRGDPGVILDMKVGAITKFYTQIKAGLGTDPIPIFSATICSMLEFRHSDWLLQVM